MRIADTVGMAALVLLTSVSAAALIAKTTAKDPPKPDTAPLIGRCGAPRPSVRLEAPVHPMEGGEYRNVLVGARGALEACMRSHWTPEVELRFGITTAGAVDWLTVRRGIDHGDYRQLPELTGCLRTVSSTLVFPSNDHAVRVSTSLGGLH